MIKAARFSVDHQLFRVGPGGDGPEKSRENFNQQRRVAIRTWPEILLIEALKCRQRRPAFWTMKQRGRTHSTRLTMAVLPTFRTHDHNERSASQTRPGPPQALLRRN